MKKGDIVIKRTGYALKYRVTHVSHIGALLVLFGIRVKYDRSADRWVSWGREHALFSQQYRLFADDDFHYEK